MLNADPILTFISAETMPTEFLMRYYCMVKNYKKSAALYNVDVYQSKGMGFWRPLYVSFINELNVESVIEVGSGSTDLLDSVKAKRRVALDANQDLEIEYQKLGIDYYQLDLDNDDFPDINNFDVAVCSDVYEHLLYPEKTLKNIYSILKSEGIMFSHVPNEFTFRKTVKVMLGISDSIYFGPHCYEHCDPHLHRFTKIGYKRFLEKYFNYNLLISDMKYNWKANVLKALRIPVPYAFETGPTYASTNNYDIYVKLKKLKTKLIKLKS